MTAPGLSREEMEAEKASTLEKNRLALEALKKMLEEKRNYLQGKFDPTKNKDFTVISGAYNMGQGTMYLRKEAYAAYLSMRAEALKSGIILNIASATRNFDYQKTLWEKKWSGSTLVEGKKLPETVPDEIERFKKILEYSAAPGTSRHHWGTDIDINGADPAYFNTEKGKLEYEWLVQNAPLFGFCQTYNQKDQRLTGYNEEKWHWSYLPLAQGFTTEYKNLITIKDITGFFGDVHAKDLNLINDYVLSINPACL